MQAVNIVLKNSKLANTGALESMNRSTFQLAGTGNLTCLGRRWLFFCVSLVRMGYEGIRAPTGAIVRAHYRSTGLETSERSAHRGLAELERAGYIRRQKFRIGRDRFASIIHFDLKRFEFWTRGPTYLKPVTPDHIDIHPPKWQETDGTSKGSRVNTLNSLGYLVNKHPRATMSKGEQFKKTSGEKGKPDRRDHEIIYSLRMATAGKGKRYRRPIIDLARYELTHPKERGSGAPWEKWLARNQETGKTAFEELSIPHERETVINEQFLPYLEAYMGLEKIQKPIKKLLKLATKPIFSKPQDIAPDETPPATPGEIRDLISAAGLEDALKYEEPQETQPATAEKFKRRVEQRLAENTLTGALGLSPDELRILERARLRAKAAKANR